MSHPPKPANRDPKLPPGIGPHEGCELELMLAGRKCVAMFSEIVPEADFAPHVRSCRIIRQAFTYPANGPLLNSQIVYFALAGEAWRIEALHKIHYDIFCNAQPATDEREAEIGRLLDYAEDDIRTYLAWRQRVLQTYRC